MGIEEVKSEYNEIKVTLADALDKTESETMSVNELIDRCISAPNIYWMWKTEDEDLDTVCYFSTHVNVRYHKLTLSIMALASTPQSTAHINEYMSDGLVQVEEAIDKTGLERITIIGRLGWKKLIENVGYKLDYATFTKKL